jgi:hypothetical protein
VLWWIQYKELKALNPVWASALCTPAANPIQRIESL